MGHTNPERLRMPPSPLTALTLAEMHIAQWELRGRCNRCKVDLRADLRALIRVYGPDTIWWGRKPKCPGFDCETGVLTYRARAIRSGSWVAMTTAPSAQNVALWKANRYSRDRGPRNT